MNKRFVASLLLSLPFVGPAVRGAQPQQAGGGYAIVDKIPGPDGMWDYAVVSADEHRLYLAQSEHISTLGLSGTGAGVWKRFGVPGALWHGVVPIESRGLVLGTNGRAHTLTLFDVRTDRVVSVVSTNLGGSTVTLKGRLAKYAALSDPDAVAVDPKTGLAAAVNGGSGEIVFVDIGRRAVVGSVHVGGKLEFAVADGGGRLYVNVQTAHEIAVIDVPTRSVVGRIPLAGCVQPKGLAYDPRTDLLISGCDNGVAKFVLAKSGKIVASRKIGRGADAVIIDERRRRAFVPSGQDAALSIFDIDDPRHIATLQTLPTEAGVRLGAVDPSTGNLYLPAATLGPPIPPQPWPSAVPGTFHVLVVSPVGKR